MSVLSDKWIKKMVKSHKIITPFIPKQTRKGKISYGLSSYGYDARVSDDFKIFTNVNSTIVDPKNFNQDGFISIFLSLKIVEARIGSVAFFEPEILIVPDKVLLPLIINFCIN